MKKRLFERYRRWMQRAGALALAGVIATGGVTVYQHCVKRDVPELVTYVDPDTVVAEEDEVPLASNKKTTRKVTTKTTTKKVTMKTKAKKTKTSTKKSTKTSTKTTSSDTQKVKTSTKVATTIKTKTKKNSKIKTTQTKVVTTVTVTTTKLAKTTAKTTSSSTTASTSKAGTYSVRSVAAAADERVLKAFESIGCKVVVNPAASYSGCFDARTRTITLQKLDEVVYHELGHFVEFVGGTAAVKQKITNAYNQEKALYTASNKAYVLQSSSEYFAESFKNYCENAAALKKARPLTYQVIVQALEAMTDSRVNTLKSVYASVWN